MYLKRLSLKLTTQQGYKEMLAPAYIWWPIYIVLLTKEKEQWEQNNDDFLPFIIKKQEQKIFNYYYQCWISFKKIRILLAKTLLKIRLLKKEHGLDPKLELNLNESS